MNSLFWDTRYQENDTVYGYEPNAFFKTFIDKHQPGNILLPAEGEGRNAIYAASKGWQVDAFDFSEVAISKAKMLAGSKNLNINYTKLNIADYQPAKLYDAVGLIYVHLPHQLRQSFHNAICRSLKPAGYLVLEAFSREQILNSSGGPKDIDMLYDAASLCNDFPFLHVLRCEQKEIELREGVFHQGKAAVLQLIGQRL